VCVCVLVKVCEGAEARVRVCWCSCAYVRERKTQSGPLVHRTRGEGEGRRKDLIGSIEGAASVGKGRHSRGAVAAGRHMQHSPPFLPVPHTPHTHRSAETLAYTATHTREPASCIAP
jgi:hypothetical protein